MLFLKDDVSFLITSDRPLCINLEKWVSSAKENMHIVSNR